MKYRHWFQTIILLAWVFFAVIVNSSFFEANIVSEVIVLICFASIGLALSFVIPFFWEKQKNANKK